MLEARSDGRQETAALTTKAPPPQVHRLATELFPSLLAVVGGSGISSFWALVFYLALILFGVGQQVGINRPGRVSHVFGGVWLFSVMFITKFMYHDNLHAYSGRQKKVDCERQKKVYKI